MNENKDFDPNAGLDYEASKKALIEKSNQRAWMVAWISMSFGFLAILAIFLLMPLKSVEAFVVKVDKSTGMIDVVTALKNKAVSTEENLDKYFISQYVKKREGYYYNLLQQDYEYVQLLSNDRVAHNYILIYDGENARDKRLNNNFEVEAKILSVVLGESAGTHTSTIRVELITKNLRSKNKTVEIKVVTLSYEYTQPLYQRESQRLLNPLGFKVLNYRIDSEVR